ncbi:MAG TPA: hypothetical protein VFH33_01000 [Candidatus Krumholzibacteria bacterium]|nr:hypothetical protein [Candidatus Krumholzibacteria bacterium]
MHKGRRVRLTWAASVIISMCFFGCTKAVDCKISPVELEELREDIAQLQKDLKTARDRETQLTADLAAKQADLATKRGKPAELRAQLDQVKKGAGKTEKAKEAPKTPAAKPAPGTPPAAAKPAPGTPPAAAKPAPATPAKPAPAAPAKPAPTDSTTQKKGNP